MRLVNLLASTGVAAVLALGVATSANANDALADALCNEEEPVALVASASDLVADLLCNEEEPVALVASADDVAVDVALA